MCCQYPSLIFIILVSSLFPTRGVKYEFIADNDEVFDKCSQIPDTNGIQDLFDLSKLNLEFQEGLISVTGDTTIVWQDVRPSDRIEVKSFSSDENPKMP